MARKIVLYVTPMCGPCEQIKAYLSGRGFDFTVVDVMMDEDAADLLDRKGIRSAPALAVDDEIVAGASLTPDQIEKMLAS